MKRIALALWLASCATVEQPREMAPPDVLARMKPNADTSHNPVLWSSSEGEGCNTEHDSIGGGGGPGCAPYRQGCGRPRGGRAGDFSVLGAIAIVLRRRRRTN